jgi:hypothetical protein
MKACIILPAIFIHIFISNMIFLTPGYVTEAPVYTAVVGPRPKLSVAWSEIQEMIGPASTWPTFLRQMFWTTCLKYYDRMQIAVLFSKCLPFPHYDRLFLC